MSSTHQAVYAPTELTRIATADRAWLALADRGAAFVGGVRGKHRDPSVDGFSYDDEDDHDLEGMESLDAALRVSDGWELTVLDSRFLQMPIELAILDGKNQRQVLLGFPSSLYSLAKQEPRTARRWCDALVAVGDAIHAPLMVCGPDVEERPYTLIELETVLQAALAAHRPGAYGIHTAVVTEQQLQVIERRVRIPADFYRQALPGGKLLLSLLEVPSFDARA